MVDSLSPSTFYDSAREFALTALEAHHAANYRRVPLDAGTALEHLAKACLSRRSPALIAELKNEGSVGSLIWLLGIEGARGAPKVRTVGLSDALTRMDLFITPAAPREDLRTLVDMRNGVVHAAQGAEVEERILAAFVQQADAFLNDMGRDRADFWGSQLGVVDALLADASDKVAHRVEVKLAASSASYEREYGDIPAERAAALRIAREMARPLAITADQEQAECPACAHSGIATGEHEVEWDVGDWDKETGTVTAVEGTVWFTADGFGCRVCGLRLDSPAEVAAAGMEPRWMIEDGDWRDYESGVDEDAEYESWRDQHRGL